MSTARLAVWTFPARTSPKAIPTFPPAASACPCPDSGGAQRGVPGVLRRTTDWAEAQTVTLTVATPVTAADTTISARVTEGRGVWTPLPVELTILDDDNMSPDVALVLTPSEVREGLVSTVTAVASGPLDDEATITVSPAPAPAGHRHRDRDLPTAPCATKRAVYPAWQRHGEARHAARRGRDGFYGRDVRHRPHARQYESDVHDVESGRGADAATHYFALKRAGRGWPGRRPVRSVAAHAAAGFLVAVASLVAPPQQAQAQTAGICGRTAEVQTAILFQIAGVTACADVTDAHLAAIGALRLASEGITALAAGDFDGLTALTYLDLRSNDLTTLPAGVFDELTELTTLSLSFNGSLTTLPAGVFDGLTALATLTLSFNGGLTTLPAGVFAGLTALTRLDLRSNALTTLPAGVFEPLTALTELRLRDNPGAPFSPTAVALPDDGTVPAAGGTVALDGSSSDGGPWGANVTYSWSQTSGPTSGVTFDDAASATPMVTIPALTVDTELTFTLTVTAPSYENSDGINASTGTATVTVFDPTAGICGRTEVVRDAIVTKISGVTSCADVTGTHLAAITGALSLNDKSITALAAGDFDGLTALATLRLQNNDLTTLPAGVFENLTALTLLKLNGNPGAPFSPTADALPDNGMVPPAGGTVALDGSDSDGGPWGANVTYSWSQTSGPTSGVTFDDAASATPVVTIPALTADTELTFTLTVTGRATHTSDGTAPDTDAATVTVVIDPTAGICGRTEAVRNAIVASISGVTDCAHVTDADLAAITGTLSLNNKSITALAAGDFDGLTALTGLYLQYNSLSSLPAGVFAGLTALTALTLNDNVLTTLPAGVFAGLTELTRLSLYGNKLTTLPAGVFAELTTLTALFLSDNALTTLPAGVFAGLTALKTLWLSDNALTTLPAEVFAGLTALATLRLQNNKLTTLPDGVFAGLRALTTLTLYGNKLTTLPDGVFAGRRALTTLWLDGNKLTTLPDGVFDKLTALTDLQLHNNDLTTLPDGVFDKLTELTKLWLYGNQLTTLPDGVFDELTALETLDLQRNLLATLPARVFDELTALETLDLQRNLLATLPARVFEELTALTLLELNGNPGAPFSPTADALPDDGTVPPAGGTVALDGSGSDGGPWGTNVTYSWSQTSGPTSGVTFDDDTSATPVVTIPALTAGTVLTFTLTVTGHATAPRFGTDTDTDTATATVRVLSTDATLSALTVNDGTTDHTIGLTTRPYEVDVGNTVTTVTLTATPTHTGASVSAVTLAGGTIDDDVFTDGITVPSLVEGDNAIVVTVTAEDGTTMRTYRVTVTVNAQETGGICGRTAAVQAAILDQIADVTACADVTDAQLAAITGELDLADQSITALAAGDFDGLIALETLWLNDNDLTMLPAGVFDELTALETLYLDFNGLTMLPAGVFDELTKLEQLYLDFNGLTMLPDGVFDELTALETLLLGDNDLTTLPAGVFDGLTALETLDLDFNGLTMLPAGVFEELTKLEELLLGDNDLNTLPAGVFDGLTALTKLWLLGNPGGALLAHCGCPAR